MEINEEGVFGFSIIGTLYLYFTIISIIAYIIAISITLIVGFLGNVQYGGGGYLTT